MTAMTTVMPRDHEWTADDLQRLPDDGLRYELVDGLLVVSPAPVVLHQRVVVNLALLLAAACPADLEVLVAPVEVRLSRRSAVQPDLLVCRREQVPGKFLAEPPSLVVEVRSPSTARYDALTKLSLYEESGVASYWLVDPDEPSVRVLELAGGRYVQRALGSGAEQVSVLAPFPVQLRAADLIG